MRTTVAAVPLLGRPEQQLFARLVRAFPGHVVMAQVALSRLLVALPAPAGAHAVSPRQRHWVADFVVCRPDFTPLAVVDCDTGPLAHEALERQRRRDNQLRAAGIKVLRVLLVDLPTEAALKALIAALPATVPAAPLMRHAS
jgi:hypothetical protein